MRARSPIESSPQIDVILGIGAVRMAEVNLHVNNVYLVVRGKVAQDHATETSCRIYSPQLQQQVDSALQKTVFLP